MPTFQKFIFAATRLLLIALAFGLFSSHCVLADAPTGKLIATGWDSPNADEFRKSVGEFEKYPFDGVTIFPTIRRADGSRVSNGFAFSREKWAADACADMTTDLQATHSRIKAHSFLFCYANPGDVDWFDDAGWTQVVDHWRQLARTARISGLRGLLFDAEPYTPPFEQFNDAHQPGAKQHTFEEYTRKARQRGREVMQAIAREYPGMTIFSYRLLSDLLSLTNPGADAKQVLSGYAYGLLPAFVNGWLDVAPPTLTLIEGNEAISYHANSPATFDRAYARLRLDIPSLLDPLHIVKYRNQVLISHGLYLDAYTNPPGSPYHIAPMGDTPATRLQYNVRAALDAADSGYVWIYGETGRWWPQRPTATPYPLWTDKFKGSADALLRAKDPVSGVHAFLKAAPDSKNMLHNADVSQRAANGLPSEWWVWQDDKSHGLPALTADALQWSNALLSVYGQNIAVKPNMQVAVSAWLKQEGRGAAFIVVRWKDAQDRWINEDKDVTFRPSLASQDAGWREACGLVTVPAGSASLVVLFVATGQTTPQDRAFCRKIQCVQIP